MNGDGRSGSPMHLVPKLLKYTACTWYVGTATDPVMVVPVLLEVSKCIDIVGINVIHTLMKCAGLQ